MMLRTVNKFSLMVIFLYLKILTTSCEKRTVAFAIDDTISMKPYIHQVRKDVKEIINIVLEKNSIHDYVLFTINDEDVVFRAKTTSQKLFLDQLNKISPRNNDSRKCEEKSLTGIEKALLASQHGSYIFVYTNASAKDYNKVEDIKKLCQKRQSQVLFMLNGDCHDPSSKNYTVYHDIAAACSGQVIHLPNQGNDLGTKLFREFLNGSFVDKWIMLKKSSKFASVSFTIDDMTNYALVAATGDVQLKLSLTNRYNYFSREPYHTRLIWNKYSKVFKVFKPRTYYILLKSKTRSSVVIYMKSNFTVSHGFSLSETNSIEYAYKQPLFGKRQHLYINVTDPSNLVEIKSAQLLDMHGDIIKSDLPLIHIGEKLYTTDKFVPPNIMFKIKVIGKVKTTQNSISRISSTTVFPTDSIPDNIKVPPNIHISEKDVLYVDYGGTVNLTCNVSSQSAPRIEWLTDEGMPQASEFQKLEEILYVSYLKVENVKKNATYSCKAINEVGSTIKKVNLNVRPVFNVISVPKETTIANYDEDVKLKCIVKSAVPMKVIWIWHGSELKNTAIHSISADGTELTLISMDIGMNGTYICEASLINEPSVKRSFITDVQITGMSPPSIKTTNIVTNANKGDNIKLECKIVEGKPEPQVQWFTKNGRNFVLLPHENKQLLIIPRASFKNVGKYKCEAKNVMGAASKDFEVNMNIAPDISIVESDRLFPYGSNFEFTCKVESQAPVTIVWTNQQGSILEGEIEKKSDYESTKKLKLRNIREPTVYSCEATNDKGSATVYVNLNVSSPFTVREHIKNITNIHYGSEQSFRCDIKSSLPIKIEWYHYNSLTKSNEGLKLINSSNKQTISRDGTELNIKFMDSDMVGNYVCIASLVSDPMKSIAFSTTVQTDSIPPSIKTTETNISKGKGDEIKLECIIIKGKPKPQVQWFKKNSRNFEVLPDENKEVLIIPQVSFENVGKYKCEVKNWMGAASKEFDVSMNIAPDIYIIESDRMFPYDSNCEFTCKVESHAPVTIVWMNQQGSILEGEMEKISDYESTKKLKLRNIREPAVYSCEATNDKGSATVYVNLNVSSPFTVREYIKNVTKIRYGSEQLLRCDIKSPLPITIKWYHFNPLANSSKELKAIDSYNKQIVSGDGTELKIKFMDLDMVGNYVCTATLVSDPMKSIAFSTIVGVSGTRPKIMSTGSSTRVIKGNMIILNCKIIEGEPKPQMRWFKKNGTTFDILPNETNESLVISKTELMHSGQYKCEANNVIGHATEEFDVVVNGMPVVTVDQNIITYPYGSDAVTTCKVESLSLPQIEWTDENGSNLQDKIKQVSQYDFEAKLKIQNIKKSGIYKCVTTNDVGSTSKTVNITVLSPFVISKHIDNITSVEYDTKKSLACEIKSSHPMTITWYKENEEVVSNGSPLSAKQYVSDDGTELTIERMDLDMVGKYTCKASLKSDSNESVLFSTDIEVTGLEPPVIEPTNKTLTFMKGEQILLPCKIIGGKPLPTIQWLKKNNGNFEKLSNNTEEIFVVPKASHSDVGQYTCEAKNANGTISKEFEVNVNSAPEIEIIETTRSFSYGSDAKFTCSIESSPPPLSVVWTDDSGIILEDKVKKITDYTFESKLKLESIKKSSIYKCSATNKVNTSFKSVNVTVLSPFVVHKNMDVSGITNIPYDAKKTLHCNITSSFPMIIKWYRENEEIILSSKKTDSSTKQYVSDDGTELTIERMDLDMVGKYTCKVYLKSDSNESVSFSSNIEVIGLEPPVIEPTNQTLTFMKGEQILLPCKIIGGKPLATIQWLKKNNGNFEKLSNNTEEIFVVPKASHSDVGQYTCEAKNANGTISKEFEVNVNSAPEIEIIETTRSFSYGSDAKFTCSIESSPPPLSVVWTDDSGIILEDKVKKITDYTFESKLKLESIKKSSIYKCSATNKVNTSFKSVNVTVLSPFVVHKNMDVSGITNIPFDAKKTLHCNITSSYPMIIKWYRENEEIILSSKKTDSSTNQYVSDDGTELTIERMDLDMVGKYTCKVYLKSDSNKSVSFSTDIEVTGLEPPVIAQTNKTLSIMKGEQIKLACEIIGGKPPPAIQWLKKNLNNYEQLLRENEDVFFVPKASYSDAGQYKCEAKNVNGTAFKEFDVRVNSAPEINIIETARSFAYGSDAEFTCKVESSPPPTSVVWTDDSGKILENKVEKHSEYESSSLLKISFVQKSARYICTATNNVKSTNKNVILHVRPVFEVREHINDSTKIKYKSTKTLRCDITALYPMQIKWYFIKSGLKTGRSNIHSSDTLIISNNGTELKIMNMDLGLVGKYTCEATLVAHPTERIAYTSNVEIFGGEPPAITNDVTNYYGVIGDYMVIQCNVTGFPKPNITWVREDLITTEFKYSVKGNVLSITDLIATYEDSPIEFRCSARNKEGTVSKKFTISVTDAFENDETYYGNSFEIKAKITEPVAIPCKIVNSNTLSVRWYLNGQLDDQTGETYIIPNANVEDEANYTCRVNTKDGPKSENYILDVGFAPVFINKVISPKIVNWLDKTENLDCSVNAKPDEEIVWLHNGKILENMNNSNRHQVTDWGEYTCTVSNVHGTLSRTFQVVSRGCYIMSDRDPLAPLLTDEIMWWPDKISNDVLVLNEDDVIKLSCPSSVNSTNGFELFPSKTELIARCDTRDRLIVEGKHFLYKNLKCKIPIEATLIRTSAECNGMNTEKIKVGFQLDDFLETYSVCYDTEKNLPVYAHVPEILLKRGQGTDLQWNNVLNKSVKDNTCKVTDKCCYMKAQLAKAADLPFGPAQSSTFIEKFNDIPIWNPCNSNRTSWQELEKKIDESLYTDYFSQSSWTGASGYHTNNDLHGGFVPRYLWKVLQHDDDFSVMVYVNDASPEDTDIRCKQPCHKFVRSEDKFTYCCSVEEFSEVFKISMENFVPENILK